MIIIISLPVPCILSKLSPVHILTPHLLKSTVTLPLFPFHNHESSYTFQFTNETLYGCILCKIIGFTKVKLWLCYNNCISAQLSKKGDPGFSASSRYSNVNSDLSLIMCFPRHQNKSATIKQHPRFVEYIHMLL
jgi:hypothetical protein